MNFIIGIYNDSLVVNEYVEILGEVKGQVVVEKGGKMDLHGVINNNLIIREGAAVFIQKGAQVIGDIVNDGGQLQILGAIYGTVLNKSGKTVVEEDAYISG